MLKKRSSRRLVISLGIKVRADICNGDFSWFHESTADKFELRRGRRQEAADPRNCSRRFSPFTRALYREGVFLRVYVYVCVYENECVVFPVLINRNVACDSVTRKNEVKRRAERTVEKNKAQQASPSRRVEAEERARGKHSSRQMYILSSKTTSSSL